MKKIDIVYMCDLCKVEMQYIGDTNCGIPLVACGSCLKVTIPKSVIPISVEYNNVSDIIDEVIKKYIKQKSVEVK